MIGGRKIDLALEAKELAEGSPRKTTRLPGVKAREILHLQNCNYKH